MSLKDETNLVQRKHTGGPWKKILWFKMMGVSSEVAGRQENLSDQGKSLFFCEIARN